MCINSIATLDGIQHFTHITELSLAENALADLTPLKEAVAAMSSLTSLSLVGNPFGPYICPPCVSVTSPHQCSLSSAESDDDLYDVHVLLAGPCITILNDAPVSKEMHALVAKIRDAVDTSHLMSHVTTSYTAAIEKQQEAHARRVAALREEEARLRDEHEKFRLQMQLEMDTVARHIQLAKRDGVVEGPRTPVAAPRGDRPRSVRTARLLKQVQARAEEEQ